MPAPTRVLIVEDHDAYATVVIAHLSLDDRVEVVGRAHDGAEAIRLVGELTPDVVTMDLHMPRMEGIAATAAIRSLPDPPRVLIVTSSDEPGEFEAALLVGAEVCFAKTEIAELVEAIVAQAP